MRAGPLWLHPRSCGLGAPEHTGGDAGVTTDVVLLCARWHCMSTWQTLRVSLRFVGWPTAAPPPDLGLGACEHIGGYASVATEVALLC